MDIFLNFNFFGIASHPLTLPHMEFVASYVICMQPSLTLPLILGRFLKPASPGMKQEAMSI